MSQEESVRLRAIAGVDGGRPELQVGPFQKVSCAYRMETSSPTVCVNNALILKVPAT